MATANDIRVQAQTLSGITMDPSTALIWLQEQIRAIAYEHFYVCQKVTETVTVPNEDGELTYTPEDYTIVRMDRVIDAWKYKRQDYELSGNTITFDNEGTYTIRYYAEPEIPATATTEIDIPTPYITALKYFLASRIRARYMGQSDTNAVSFYEEYTNQLKEADVIMKRRTSRHRVMPPGRRGL